MADCPCLQLVECVIREGKLHMKVVFRSNDMLTAAGANMFALATLQEYIAGESGLPCGSYTHISLSLTSISAGISPISSLFAGGDPKSDPFRKFAACAGNAPDTRSRPPGLPSNQSD